MTAENRFSDSRKRCSTDVTHPTMEDGYKKSRKRFDVNVNDTYLAVESKSNNLDDDDEFSGQFKCSVSGCGKILPHNVAMICHMWSHVVCFTKRPNTSDNTIMNEVKSLERCSHCLSVYHTPYDCTKHYMEVHRRNIATPHHYVCNTCERSETMGHFTSEHPCFELPYECRFCKSLYGCRDALLRHFAKVHINTTRLMCPFCPFVTSLPVSYQNRAVVKPTVFVEHMQMHAKHVTPRCTQCVYKFLSESMFKSHRKFHSGTFQVSQSSVKSIQALQNSIPASTHLAPMLSFVSCKVCKSVFTSFGEQNHFGPKTKCSDCQYETECSTQLNKHVALCDKNPKNQERFEFAFNPQNFVMTLRGGLDADEPNLAFSPAFIQNFGSVRDFALDNPVASLLDKPRDFEVDPNTGFAKQPDRYECLKPIISSRKLNVMQRHGKETLLTAFTYADSPIDESYLNFVKKIRRPVVSYYRHFLDCENTSGKEPPAFAGDDHASVEVMEVDDEVDAEENVDSAGDHQSGATPSVNRSPLRAVLQANGTANSRFVPSTSAGPPMTRSQRRKQQQLEKDNAQQNIPASTSIPGNR